MPMLGCGWGSSCTPSPAAPRTAWQDPALALQTRFAPPPPPACPPPAADIMVMSYGFSVCPVSGLGARGSLQGLDMGDGFAGYGGWRIHSHALGGRKGQYSATIGVQEANN